MRNLVLFIIMNWNLIVTSSHAAFLTKLHSDGIRAMKTWNSPSRPFCARALSASSRNIGIVGGGLAGLSCAYHLLQKTVQNGDKINLTIFDQGEVGCAGASSVAGGLLHPFSPRGKLVHLGLEGLQCTNTLIEAALKHEPSLLLRPHLFRVAQTPAHVENLKATAEKFSEYATWMSAEELKDQLGEGAWLGGLKFDNGCRVVHVPTYLKGLWKECQVLSQNKVEWVTSPISQSNVAGCLNGFDDIVLAAGSGLWMRDGLEDGILGADFPVELVRGQSVEMHIDPSLSYPNEGILCGKYVVPRPGENKVLIGATHEYKDLPWTEAEVNEDLMTRSRGLAPVIWEKGHVEAITSGVRVQSRRGPRGRMPIVGLWEDQRILQSKVWLFSGLSSRGLIYHGVFGDILSSAILEGNDQSLLTSYPETAWWKRQ